MFKKLKSIFSMCFILIITIGLIGFFSQKIREKNNTMTITLNSWYESSKHKEKIIENHSRNNENEEVVVNIQKDGYVTMKKSAYHYYQGDIPAKSYFSSQLLAPENYHYQNHDLQKEYETLYIVKIGEKYFIVLKNPNDKSHLRDTE